MKLLALALVASFAVANANTHAVDCKKPENSAKAECAKAAAEAAKADATKPAAAAPAPAKAAPAKH